MPRFTRHPGLWFLGWLGWAGLLWFFSSIEGSDKPPPFPQFDKIEHFTYFFAGGLLAAGLLFFRNPIQADWGRIIVIATIILAITGIIDEWHQVYTPGRSGADPWDWLADLLGGMCGARAFKAVHRRLQRDS